jgi:hypothetical protein
MIYLGFDICYLKMTILSIFPFVLHHNRSIPLFGSFGYFMGYSS